MKNKIILFLAVVFALTSCTNNNSGSNITVTESDLAGIWNVTDTYQEGTTTTTIFGEEIVGTFVATGRDYDFTYDFGTNPNTLTANGSYIATVSLTVAGQTETTEEPVTTVDGLSSGTWSVNGNILSVTANGETTEAVIEEFDGNRLVIRADYLIEIDAQVFSNTNQGTLTITMVR